MLTFDPLSGRRVLVVDDDEIIGDVLVSYLRREGLSVGHVQDGFAALEELRQVRPDAVILDRMLPGIDGLEVCRRIRARADTPILLVTALGSEDDRIAGLEAGADDYVVKPFSPRELVLRVKAQLRRTVEQASANPDAAVGRLRLDGARNKIWNGREPLTLAVREFNLLAFLLRHPGQVFDRETLLRCVWGWDVGDLSTITVHVRRLREKIEVDPGRPRILRTIWGVGYLLTDEPAATWIRS
jgi:DNA-binding response OmpR family regulator